MPKLGTISRTQRTGLRVQDSPELTGQQVIRRDCVHYGCSGGWHAVDCEFIGLFGIDPYFDRPWTDEIVARPVKSRKAVDQ